MKGTLQDTAKSEPSHSKPRARRRPRRLWPALTGLSILVAALVVFAWQGGDGDGPPNAIAAAAERTRDEPGGRATVRGVISSPVRSESFTFTGQMVFDAGDRTKGVVRVPSPESDDLVEMHMVSDGNVIYMRSSVLGPLPDEREWMALDLSSFPQAPDTALPANTDATGELELLETVSDEVRKLGKEDVRGVPTTRYRTTVDVSERAEQLREEGADDLASRIEAGSSLRIDAWIGADGLIRRTRIVQTQPREDGEGSMTVDMRMDLFDLGIDPEIDVPEESEVFDATAMALSELGLPTDD